MADRPQLCLLPKAHVYCPVVAYYCRRPSSHLFHSSYCLTAVFSITHATAFCKRIFSFFSHIFRVPPKKRSASGREKKKRPRRSLILLLHAFVFVVISVIRAASHVTSYEAFHFVTVKVTAAGVAFIFIVVNVVSTFLTTGIVLIIH